MKLPGKKNHRFDTMQKLINVLALASFAVSASVVGAGAYVYLNKDALTEKVKEQVAAAIGAAIGEQLGGTLTEELDTPTLPF